MRGKSFILEIGARYGSWVVVGRAPSIEHNKGVFTGYHTVKCDCGTVKNIRTTCLKRGLSKSCRCSFTKSPLWLPFGESAFNTFFMVYKDSAKKRNFKWKLSKSKFKELTSKTCHYCGALPVPRFGYKRNGPALVNGVDRKNSRIRPYYR